jgi:hypothetical protein
MAGSLVATTQSRKGKGIVRIDIALTCATGVVTAAPIGSAFGRLVAVAFDPVAGAGATMTTTADFTLTDSLTGATIFSTLDFGTARVIRPTMVITDNVGVAVTAAATAVDVNRDIFVAGPMKAAIANATTTDTGLVSLFIEEG